MLQIIKHNFSYKSVTAIVTTKHLVQSLIEKLNQCRPVSTKVGDNLGSRGVVTFCFLSGCTGTVNRLVMVALFSCIHMTNNWTTPPGIHSTTDSKKTCKFLYIFYSCTAHDLQLRFGLDSQNPLAGPIIVRVAQLHLGYSTTASKKT